jgi:hypothetical protein
MIAYLSFFVPWCLHLIIYLKKPQKTMKFKRRHGEFEQGCVLSESYAATDTLPPILPACRQPLLPACVFVTRDTVCHPRLFCWENLFVMKGVSEPRFHCIALGQVKQVLNTKAMLLHKQFYKTFINSVNKPLTMIDQLHYVHNTSNLYPIWSKCI